MTGNDGVGTGEAASSTTDSLESLHKQIESVCSSALVQVTGVLSEVAIVQACIAEALQNVHLKSSELRAHRSVVQNRLAAVRAEMLRAERELARLRNDLVSAPTQPVAASNVGGRRARITKWFGRFRGRE